MSCSRGIANRAPHRSRPSATVPISSASASRDARLQATSSTACACRTWPAFRSRSASVTSSRTSRPGRQLGSGLGHRGGHPGEVSRGLGERVSRLLRGRCLARPGQGFVRGDDRDGGNRVPSQVPGQDGIPRARRVFQHPGQPVVKLGPVAPGAPRPARPRGRGRGRTAHRRPPGRRCRHRRPPPRARRSSGTARPVDRREQVRRRARADHRRDSDQRLACVRHRRQATPDHVTDGRWNGRGVLAGRQRPAQLAGEEGMPAAPGMHGPSPARRGVRPGDRGDQAAHLGLAEALQRNQLGRHHQLGEAGDHLGPAGGLAVRADEEQPPGAGATDQERDQVQGRRVAPLEVVEDDDDTAAGGRRGTASSRRRRGAVPAPTDPPAPRACRWRAGREQWRHLGRDVELRPRVRSAPRSASVHGHQAGACWPSQHVPHTTVAPARSTSSANRRSSAVLPIPASPVTSTSPVAGAGVPVAASATARCAATSLASGSERPTNSAIATLSPLIGAGGRCQTGSGGPAAFSGAYRVSAPSTITGGHHDHHVRRRGVQADHPEPVGGGRRGLAPLGADHRGLARRRRPTTMLDRAGVARRRPSARRSRRRRRPDAARRRERVGPGGHVLATDISPAILEYAASTAAAAGLGNVSTQELDGEHLDVEPAAFDAVISRVGLIYFPDQQAALRGMYDALRTGWPAVVGRVLDGRPQRLLLGPGRHHPAPGAAAASAARPAGTVQPRRARASPRTRSRPRGSATSPSTSSSRRCGWRPQRSASGSRRSPSVRCTRCSRGCPRSEREEAWAEIGEALAQFEGPDGFTGPCEMLVVTGTK